MFHNVELLIKEKNYRSAFSELCLFSEDIKTELIFLKKIAYVALRCDEITLAKDIYEQILKVNKEDLRTYLDYAQILIKEKKFENAEDFLLKAIQTYPKNISLLSNLALISKIMNNSLKEIQYSYQLVELNKSVKYYTLLVSALISNNEFNRANKVLDEAVSYYEEKEFLLLKIKLYIKLDRLEDLLLLYGKLLKTSPNEYTVYIGMFRVLDQLHRKEDAIKCLLDALSKVKNNKNIQEALSNAYIRYKKPKYAIKYLNILLETDVENVKYHQKLATAYNNLGDFNISLKILSEVEKQFSIKAKKSDELFEIFLAKAKIYQTILNWQEGVDIIDKALNIKPYDSEANLILAQLKMKQHHYDRAHAILDYILSFNSTHKKTKIYIQENIRLQALRKLEIEHYENNFSCLIPKTLSQYRIKSDVLVEYIELQESVNILLKALNDFKNDASLLSRLIINFLRLKQYYNASYYWELLLENHNFNTSFLYLTRFADIYKKIEDKNIDILLKKTEQSVSTYLKKNYESIQNIAILGGSNTVVKDGWYYAFYKNIKKYTDIKVDNYGLGGISSLFGLSLIIEKEIFKQYDIVIFEYTLNDIFFSENSGYSSKILAGVICELVTQAKKSNCRLIFLMMSPLNSVNKEKISSLYISYAKEYFFINNLIDDIDSDNFLSALYRDNMHYTSQFSQDIADLLTLKVLQKPLVLENKKIDNSEIVHNKMDLSNMYYINAKDFKVFKNYKYITRETNIICRNFLSIEKDTFISITIPKAKQVMAILINSSENTGYIKVSFGDIKFIKNIFADRPIGDKQKARIYLKQFTKVLINYDAETVLTLSVNVTQKDLDTLPLDITVYSQLPRIALDKQELEISGVLIA